jgi:transcriptional regulator NrdR family protein
MKCPICQAETKVLDSRSTDKVTTRRRECIDCLTRFSTQENVVTDSLDSFLQSQMVQIDYEASGKGKWTKSETEYLVAMYVERIPHKEIAKALNRSYMGVSQRISRLKQSGRLLKK